MKVVKRANFYVYVLHVDTNSSKFQFPWLGTGVKSRRGKFQCILLAVVKCSNKGIG
jgi:hypothetical protein